MWFWIAFNFILGLVNMYNYFNGGGNSSAICMAISFSVGSFLLGLELK